MVENSFTVKRTIVSSLKYAYLVAFFALLSGIFYPILKDHTYDNLIVGILILFLGLGGGILVYKGTTYSKKPLILIPIGLVLIITSLFLVNSMTNFPFFELLWN